MELGEQGTFLLGSRTFGLLDVVLAVLPSVHRRGQVSECCLHRVCVESLSGVRQERMLASGVYFSEKSRMLVPLEEVCKELGL